MKKAAFFVLMVLSVSFPANADGLSPLAPMAKPKLYRLDLPGKSFALEIDLSGFAVRKMPGDSDQASLEGSNKATGLNVSVFIEKAAKDGDAKVAREFYWNRLQSSPLKGEDVKFSERNGAAILEYIIKMVSWKNINMYLSHDGFWIDIHLSKISFRPSDEKSFEAILNSAHIVEK
jgi:hypothetical protein